MSTDQLDYAVPAPRQRRQQTPIDLATSRDKENHVMWAPGLPVKLSPRHEAVHVGVTEFPAGTLILLEEHTYPTPLQNRANLMVRSSAAERSGKHVRLPGVIARRLVENYGAERFGGTSVLQSIDAFIGAEDNYPDSSDKSRPISKLYDRFGVTFLRALQMMTFPAIPAGYGALLARYNHLVGLVGQPLEEKHAANLALLENLVAKRDPDAFRRLELELHASFDALRSNPALEDKLNAGIDEMVDGLRDCQIRLEGHANTIIAEMDSRSRSEPGKPTTDAHDRKVYTLLGSPVPQLARNVHLGSSPTAAAGAPTIGQQLPAAGSQKECVACAEWIMAKAKKCRYCGEAQPVLQPSNPLEQFESEIHEPLLVESAADDQVDEPTSIADLVGLPEVEITQAEETEVVSTRRVRKAQGG